MKKLYLQIQNIKIQIDLHVEVADGELIVQLLQDATGNVTIFINGINDTAEVIDGIASFNVSSFEYGSYSFEANYTGDDKYNESVEKSTVIIDNN